MLQIPSRYGGDECGLSGGQGSRQAQGVTTVFDFHRRLYFVVKLKHVTIDFNVNVLKKNGKHLKLTMVQCVMSLSNKEHHILACKVTIFYTFFKAYTIATTEVIGIKISNEVAVLGVAWLLYG